MKTKSQALLAGSAWSSVLSGTRLLLKKLLIGAFSFVAGAALSMLCFQNVQAQMATPGSFAVSDMGAATYSVPIGVPQGVGGVTPQLSLLYSSQAPNGLLGVGWSLTGLSVIGRCAATSGQDNIKGHIGYDLNDRYCLDGQRLIAVSGANGADQTEYRTEHDGLSKIISYGAAGISPQGGPQYFIVKTKAGLTMQYGNTADSRIEAQGKTVVRVWALNKVSDTKGNYMTIAYTEDNANGQYVPSRIDYTGNSATGLAAMNSVRFDYETRPDIVPKYQMGSLIKSTQRLTRVWTNTTAIKAGVTSTPEVGEVRIAYESGNSPATMRSRVSTIQTCDGPAGTSTSKCLPAVKLTWSGSAPTFTSQKYSITWPLGAPATSFGTPADSHYQWFTGDFNGDGRTDFIELLGATYYVFINKGDGTFTNQVYTLPNGWNFDNTSTDTSAQYKVILGDFNGDGRTDFMGMNGANCYMMLANSDGTFSASTIGVFAIPRDALKYFIGSANSMISNLAGANIMIADYNGDGKIDFSFIVDYSNSIQVFLSNGDGTFSWKRSDFSQAQLNSMLPQPYGSDSAWVYSDSALSADFNADGFSDISFKLGPPPLSTTPIAYYTRAFAINNGDGYFSIKDYGGCASTSSSSPLCSFDSNVLAIDLNGDGLADWNPVTRVDGQYTLSYHFVVNAGGLTAADSFAWGAERPASFSHFYPNLALAFQGDMDGDQLVDYVYLLPDGGASPYVHGIQFEHGKGDGTFTEALIPFPSDLSLTTTNYQLMTGDFNGDGRTDFLLLSGGSYYMFTSSGDIPDLVTKIEQGVGLGTSVTINYKTPSQMYGSGYVSELTPTYPKQTTTPTFPVVSKVSMANGVGGTHDVTYRYGTALNEMGTGRGFLGFNWTEHTDGPSGLISRTYFRQDWPYLGQVSKTAEYTSSGVWTGSAAGAPVLSNPGSYVKQQVNSYACLDISAPSADPLPLCAVGAGQRYFVFASKVVTSGQDLDGTALPGVRTTQTLDGWGNPLSIIEETLDGTGALTGYSKVTTNNYANDTTNWYLGRLLSTTVSAIAP